MLEEEEPGDRRPATKSRDGKSLTTGGGDEEWETGGDAVRSHRERGGSHRAQVEGPGGPLPPLVENRRLAAATVLEAKATPPWWRNKTREHSHLVELGLLKLQEETPLLPKLLTAHVPQGYEIGISPIPSSRQASRPSAHKYLMVCC